MSLCSLCVCVCVYVSVCATLDVCHRESRIIHLILNTHTIIHHERVIVMANNKCIKNGLCVCAHVRFVCGDKESKTVHVHNSDRVHCYGNNKSVINGVDPWMLQ